MMACYETCTDKGVKCDFPIEKLCCPSCGKVKSCYQLPSKQVEGSGSTHNCKTIFNNEKGKVEKSQYGKTDAQYVVNGTCECSENCCQWLLRVLGLREKATCDCEETFSDASSTELDVEYFKGNPASKEADTQRIGHKAISRTLSRSSKGDSTDDVQQKAPSLFGGETKKRIVKRKGRERSPSKGRKRHHRSRSTTSSKSTSKRKRSESPVPRKKRLGVRSSSESVNETSHLSSVNAESRGRKLDKSEKSKLDSKSRSRSRSRSRSISPSIVSTSSQIFKQFRPRGFKSPSLGAISQRKRNPSTERKVISVKTKEIDQTKADVAKPRPTESRSASVKKVLPQKETETEKNTPKTSKAESYKQVSGDCCECLDSSKEAQKRTKADNPCTHSKDKGSLEENKAKAEICSNTCDPSPCCPPNSPARPCLRPPLETWTQANRTTKKASEKQDSSPQNYGIEKKEAKDKKDAQNKGLSAPAENQEASEKKEAIGKREVLLKKQGLAKKKEEKRKAGGDTVELSSKTMPCEPCCRKPCCRRPGSAGARCGTCPPLKDPCSCNKQLPCHSNSFHSLLQRSPSPYVPCIRTTNYHCMPCGVECGRTRCRLDKIQSPVVCTRKKTCHKKCFISPKGCCQERSSLPYCKPWEPTGCPSSCCKTCCLPCIRTFQVLPYCPRPKPVSRHYASLSGCFTGSTCPCPPGACQSSAKSKPKSPCCPISGASSCCSSKPAGCSKANNASTQDLLSKYGCPMTVTACSTCPSPCIPNLDICNTCVLGPRCPPLNPKPNRGNCVTCGEPKPKSAPSTSCKCCNNCSRSPPQCSSSFRSNTVKYSSSPSEKPVASPAQLAPHCIDKNGPRSEVMEYMLKQNPPKPKYNKKTDESKELQESNESATKKLSKKVSRKRKSQNKTNSALPKESEKWHKSLSESEQLKELERDCSIPISEHLGRDFVDGSFNNNHGGNMVTSVSQPSVNTYSRPQSASMYRNAAYAPYTDGSHAAPLTTHVNFQDPWLMSSPSSYNNRVRYLKPESYHQASYTARRTIRDSYVKPMPSANSWYNFSTNSSHLKGQNYLSGVMKPVMSDRYGKLMYYMQLEQEVGDKIMKIKSERENKSLKRLSEKTNVNHKTGDFESNPQEKGNMSDFFVPRKSFVHDMIPMEEHFTSESWKRIKNRRWARKKEFKKLVGMGVSEEQLAELIKDFRSGSDEKLELNSSTSDPNITSDSSFLSSTFVMETHQEMHISKSLSVKDKCESADNSSTSEKHAVDSSIIHTKNESSVDIESNIEPRWLLAKPAILPESNPEPKISVISPQVRSLLKKHHNFQEKIQQTSSVDLPSKDEGRDNNKTKAPVFQGMFEKFGESVQIFVRTKTGVSAKDEVGLDERQVLDDKSDNRVIEDNIDFANSCSTSKQVFDLTSSVRDFYPSTSTNSAVSSSSVSQNSSFTLIPELSSTQSLAVDQGNKLSGKSKVGAITAMKDSLVSAFAATLGSRESGEVVEKDTLESATKFELAEDTEGTSVDPSDFWESKNNNGSSTDRPSDHNQTVNVFKFINTSSNVKFHKVENGAATTEILGAKARFYNHKVYRANGPCHDQTTNVYSKLALHLKKSHASVIDSNQQRFNKEIVMENGTPV